MWQPIETAPKDDETWLLLCQKGKYAIPVIGMWDHEWECWISHRFSYENTAKMCNRQSGREVMSETYQPAYWMPLPIAPEAQNAPSAENAEVG